MNRMLWLTQALHEAAYAYYQQDREIMPDIEYDRLMDELIHLEKTTGLVLSNSPTRKVGYTVLSNLAKVRHESPMLSLDKTKELAKLHSFLAGQNGLLSWKLDGLAIALKYAGGRLVQAITRGNGEIGEDVTHNAMVFHNLPVQIQFPGELEVRGEAVISYSAFAKINESIDPAERYKNPRNLCSGTVRQLNSEIAAARNVLFFAYTVSKAEGISFDGLKSKQLPWLAGLGFEPVEYLEVDTGNLTEAVQYFETKAGTNDFASDGLVLTYNSIPYSESLGATTKFPRHSIAYKWKDEMWETTLQGIHWNTSRTGLINPIAVFEPVDIEGSTVNKASLHNVSIVRGLELGVGDVILVYKANMIIPQVADNLTRTNSAVIPAHCPMCGGETELVRLRDGEALYCTNPNCKAQLIRSLAHFASRDAMNIEGFSLSTIEKFAEKGFLTNYTDIYALARHEGSIRSMDGFGEKSCRNLLEAIEKSKDTSLPNFIYALGINHVGLSNAKLLCKHFLYNIDSIKAAQPEDLLAVDGFGEVIAHSVSRYFQDEKNLSLLDTIWPLLRLAPAPALGSQESQGQDALANLIFAITGDLSMFKNRKELQTHIESRGGKVTSSVTGKTSYLINNDKDAGTAKNKKARELGVAILSEAEFIEQYGNSAIETPLP